MPTTSTTSPHGAVTCAEPEAPAPVVADVPDVPVEATPEVEARRRWLATAAWPEVAFASA